MLLTGGSAVVESLTGMPTAAACFLFPIGVVIYTMLGGIKATFLTDYVNSLVIIIIIFLFAFTAYATNTTLGSPGEIYDILQDLVKQPGRAVENNAEGSYLTMQSKSGAIFFVINIGIQSVSILVWIRADTLIVGNFGTVFCDNACTCTASLSGPRL